MPLTGQYKAEQQAKNRRASAMLDMIAAWGAETIRAPAARNYVEINLATTAIRCICCGAPADQVQHD